MYHGHSLRSGFCFFFLTLSNYFGRNKFIIIEDYGDRTDNFERRLTVERLSLVLV